MTGSEGSGFITIRPASAGDAAAIATVHCESWRDTYAGVLDPAYLAGPVVADRLEVWTDRLARPGPLQEVLVAEIAPDELVGFVCLFRDVDARWGSLVDNLHVHPGWRGRSIGERLLRAAITGLDPDRPFHLWVFEANAGAVRFYQRLGGMAVERTLDDMPEARGAPVLRMAWRQSASLRKQD